MMNDFDFIKDQIDKSGVSAPEHMDESYVLSQLGDTQPDEHPKVVPFRRKPPIGRIIAVAAAIVAVAAIGTAVGIRLYNARITPPAVSKDTGLIQFTNHDQVRSVLNTIDERNRRYLKYQGGDEDYVIVEEDAASGSVGASSGKGAADTNTASYAGAGSTAHSETYKQVEGVDEADIIKTDGRYIYAVNRYNGGVAVFPAQPGTVDPILNIIPGKDGAATPDEAEPEEDVYYSDAYISGSSRVNEFFLKDARLVILCSEYTYGADYESYTCAYVYDVADMDHVALLDSYTQSGDYTSSRMIGDTLYLITTEYGASDIPVCGRGSTPDQLPAGCIYSVEDPEENTFLIVSAYDTLDHTAASETKAILGAAEDIYCNEENLYITATEYHYGNYYIDIDYLDDEEGAAVSDVAQEPEYEPPTTRIYKVSLTDGIAFTAYCEVEGYIDSQYSLDEYNGNLRVAATTQNEDYEQTNNLYVLDGGLNLIGSVTGFADDEHIEAVRYVGDTAYVITYRTTDPLFVIDLSEPTAPAILGEVKISGFSTMLVPLDENTILGLGISTDDYEKYDDIEVQDGYKIALFDVSDPTDPQVLDSRSYLNCSSEVMYNPKALVYNADRGDFVIPLNYYRWDYDEDTDEWSSEQYGGMLNFAVLDGKITEIDRYRSEQEYIERCVYVGDTIYMTYSDTNGSIHLESVSYR